MRAMDSGSITTMQFSLGRRIRAARQLAGFSNTKALAAAIARSGLAKRGLGTTSLYDMERDQATPDFGNLTVIADVCGLPVDFFTVDFSRLPELSDDPRKVVAQELAAATARAEARRAGRLEAIRPPHEEAR